jgi:tRNA pseudouridine65 synthase
MKLEILFRSETMIAVNKPGGLLVHPSSEARDKVTCLSVLRNQVGHWVFPVRRLDRATSGVLLFAVSASAASQLCGQFANFQIEKTYLAIVRGRIERNQVIDWSLREGPGSPLVEAQTRVECLAHAEIMEAHGKHSTSRYSLIKAFPKHGRRNQIRKHLKHVFHPIVGDTVYGDGVHNRIFRERFGISRLLLHASELKIPVGNAGQELCLNAPVPAELIRLQEELSWIKLEKFIANR